MFGWLRKILSINNNIHLHVHVDGKILVSDDRQRLSRMDDKGSEISIAPKDIQHDEQGAAKNIEVGVDPSFFADTQETKVSFGNEFDPTSGGNKDKDK